LKTLLCTLVVLLCGGRLFAQAAPAGVGPGTSVSIGGGISMYKLQYGERWLGGAHGWIDANPYWWLGVEGEARWLRLNQDANTHATTYLIGPRVSLRSGKLEPYVKVLAGAGKFNFPFNYAKGTYMVVAGGGGVDLHLGDRWKIRAIDIEYQTWPQFTFGAMKSYGASIGISYNILGRTTKLSR